MDDAVGGNAEYVNATQIATQLLGDAIGANLFMLGLAFQRGAVPLRLESLVRAIEMNGVAVKMNLTAFAWGREAGLDLAEVERKVCPSRPIAMQMPRTLDALLRVRADFLTGYQDAAYAQRYLDTVSRVRGIEKTMGLGETLTREVAKGLFKLMAYKDEYEVARLFTAPEFKRALDETFEGDFKLAFNLAPPILSKRDLDGRLIKRQFPGLTMLGFRLLVRMRRLRGGAFDIFGKTAERRTERQLIVEYEDSIQWVLSGMTAEIRDIGLALARLPDQIRGYGHVKEASIAVARAKQKELLDQLQHRRRSQGVFGVSALATS